RFHLRFSLEGDIVKGGNMKGDPCDEGFEQLAQKYDDVYGPQDVLCGADMERGVIMTADKMEYYVYLAKGDYPSDKDGTLLLDSYVEYDFCTRSHQSLLIKRPSQSDTDVAVDWSVIQVAETQMFLNDFNSSKDEDTGVTLIDVKNHLFNIILPEEAGVYSLRFVAKKDGKVIHDEIIEDIELPAYQHPFPY
ncbi:MAG: hypothetical protein K2N86_02440, partial [Rikenellaceae bacterium]|nr:hypothetical protein [Rikenellaceae bacterium]